MPVSILSMQYRIMPLQKATDKLDYSKQCVDVLSSNYDQTLKSLFALNYKEPRKIYNTSTPFEVTTVSILYFQIRIAMKNI